MSNFPARLDAADETAFDAAAIFEFMYDLRTKTSETFEFTAFFSETMSMGGGVRHDFLLLHKKELRSLKLTPQGGAPPYVAATLKLM